MLGFGLAIGGSPDMGSSSQALIAPLPPPVADLRRLAAVVAMAHPQGEPAPEATSQMLAAVWGDYPLLPNSVKWLRLTGPAPTPRLCRLPGLHLAGGAW